MADVSSDERKVKLTKNGKVVKRRLRNPEGTFEAFKLLSVDTLIHEIPITLLIFSVFDV